MSKNFAFLRRESKLPFGRPFIEGAQIILDALREVTHSTVRRVPMVRRKWFGDEMPRTSDGSLFQIAAYRLA